MRRFKSVIDPAVKRARSVAHPGTSQCRAADRRSHIAAWSESDGDSARPNALMISDVDDYRRHFICTTLMRYQKYHGNMTKIYLHYYAIRLVQSALGIATCSSVCPFCSYMFLTRSRMLISYLFYHAIISDLQ